MKETERRVEKQIVVEQRPLRLETFVGVGKFKSVRRAIRRGDCTEGGMIVPKSPFNNRGDTSRRSHVHSRVNNEYKKQIYGELIKYSRAN